ncbi:MAG: GDP-mannose 4,6-dehydratase [Candidatus Bathyarchaeota archaeon]|nr:GDP-mannose 4,6-dehydratase [Candidatus Bathyarchaeota archaeon]
MRVLITGGSGFIGSHLVDYCLNLEYETVVLDNFFSGQIKNIKQNISDKKFRLIKGDVRNPKDVEKALENIDAIFHLAAIVNIPLSIENPTLVNEVNVQGTINLLEASVKKDIKCFVYASTCAVYGEAKYLPIDEEHPADPLSPYGASKLAAEHYCKVFHKIYGLHTICLRFFNIYGPRQPSGPSGGVITTFIESIKRNRPILIYGDGNQTRDFLYIKDAIEACILALTCRDCSGKTFNIGTGTKTSINELAEELIKQANKSHVKIRHVAERKGDIKESYANIRKAQKELGFKPKFSIHEGLKELINFFDLACI